MINIPIWLFILFCIFGFIGLCCFILFIYGIVVSIFKPDYIYVEGDLPNEDDTTPNQQN